MILPVVMSLALVIGTVSAADSLPASPRREESPPSSSSVGALPQDLADFVSGIAFCLAHAPETESEDSAHRLAHCFCRLEKVGEWAPELDSDGLPAGNELLFISADTSGTGLTLKNIFELIGAHAFTAPSRALPEDEFDPAHPLGELRLRAADEKLAGIFINLFNADTSKANENFDLIRDAVAGSGEAIELLKQKLINFRDTAWDVAGLVPPSPPS